MTYLRPTNLGMLKVTAVFFRLSCGLWNCRGNGIWVRNVCYVKTAKRNQHASNCNAGAQ